MTKNGSEIISGQNVLISELGYWPEFCDAKILELKFHQCDDETVELSLLLHYIDMDLSKELNVRLVLQGVSKMSLAGLSYENIVDKIGVTAIDETSVALEIEACVGVYGSCECKQVNAEVIFIKPYINQ